MIVGVNYQVEFDEIPELIERLNEEAFDIAQDELVEEIHMATKMLQEDNLVRSLEFLERVQDVITRINMKITNSADILKSYTKHRVEPPTQEQQQAAEAAEGTDLSTLQQRLGEMQEQMRSLNEQTEE